MSQQEKIVDKLVQSYWSEIETVMNYLAHSVNLDGVRAEEVKKSLANEITEELTHAQNIAKRIKELGGTVPKSHDFKYAQPYLQSNGDTTDVVSVIKGVIEAEKTAIDQYKELIKLCEQEDYVTQELGIDNLANEETHKTVFEGFLKEYMK
jgi:bacterioferritin